MVWVEEGFHQADHESSGRSGPERGSQGVVHHVDHHDDQEEMEQKNSISLGHVDLPSPFDCLEAQFFQVTTIVEKLARDCHDDRNEIIGFMNDL